jgi:hypothetical protein
MGAPGMEKRQMHTLSPVKTLYSALLQAAYSALIQATLRLIKHQFQHAARLPYGTYTVIPRCICHTVAANGWNFVQARFSTPLLRPAVIRPATVRSDAVPLRAAAMIKAHT